MQIEGFVSFVFTIHLKVSGKKMKSIIFCMFTYEGKTTLERCQCKGLTKKTRVYPNRFAYTSLLSNL